ncbi:hypothetical protein D1AOALGA4SA_11784 [Olavius algarvensis Delta 1 endosymbiont]|nr:hypothetical protein D1AOALGA4SA_11784 [Olavius algarvensis Delta 1 endosymbiont]
MSGFRCQTTENSRQMTEKDVKMQHQRKANHRSAEYRIANVEG